MSCRSGRITSGLSKGMPCGCGKGNNCNSCRVTAAEAVCRECDNGFYLHNGSCVARCPPELTSLGFGPKGSTKGRRCAAVGPGLSGIGGSQPAAG